MKLLFTGGSKSGKSELAEAHALKLAGAGERPCIYIATMLPQDDEDRKRIAAHIKRRGNDFLTLECPKDIESLLPKLSADDTILLDSVTALFTNELFPAENGYAPDLTAKDRLILDLVSLARSVKNAVFVMDSPFYDARNGSDTTEEFRRGLGAVGCALAAECDSVIEAVFGMSVSIK